MRISSEGNRTRWLIMAAVWTIMAVLLLMQAAVVRDYLNVVGGLGLRGAPEPSTPLQQIFPSFAADAQTWVRHALSLTEGDGLRLRYTSIDNGTQGREVHWNSAWAWIIACAGYLDHWLSDSPLPRSIERMTIWLMPVVLLGMLVILSGYAARRAGAIVGTFVAVAIVGHPRVFEGFFPGYADHHGLLTVAVLGMMLGATLMGAGWWQEKGETTLRILPRSSDSARQAAVFSALCGAGGMWVSAASAIPPIAIVGIAGLTAAILMGRTARREGVQFDAEVWRTWGRVGAIASLFFYLLEYFPSHVRLRLEANHPFYSIAWLGGGYLIAEIGERWLAPSSDWLARWQRLALPVCAVFLPLIAILLGREQVFLVLDPFLAGLHQNIQEFLPLWKTIRGTGWATFFSVVGLENLPLLVALAVLAIRRDRSSILLWFVTLAALMFTVFAWIQARWLLNASGSQVCLALVLLASFAENARLGTRWIAMAATLGALFSQTLVTRFTGTLEDVRMRRVSPKDAQGALNRDIASTIRASAGDSAVVLLTNPNSSTAIGYFGRFRTLGTLYWENVEGLKAAAAIHAARSPEEAMALVRKHRVTHIAMISEENFIEQYYRLLHPGATDAEIRKCFGCQLLVDRSVPPWLRMIPYKVPDDLASLNITVLLFKVAFDQTPADALYHIALGKIALGLLPDAERDLDTLIQRSPDSFQPWMRKGELLLARHEWEKAATATINGITRAPAAQRPGLFGAAAGSFYRQSQPAQAARIYRAGLADRFDPNLAAYLAFVLASSKDDTLRNGAEALALAEKALASEPNSPTVLNSLAAALAENGRFQEAVLAADRALAIARQQGDEAAQRVSEQRLALFKGGKPLRE